MYAQLKAYLRNKDDLPGNKLRKEGMIPAVLYSKHTGSQAIKIKKKTLDRCLHGDRSIFEIEIDGKKHLASIKEIQKVPISSKILHISFLAIKKGEKAELDIPIKLIGGSIKSKEHVVITQLLNEIKIKCAPKDAPEHLELSISELAIGDHFTLADLKLPPGVELLATLADDLKQTIVTCALPKKEEKEPAGSPAESEAAADSAVEAESESKADDPKAATEGSQTKAH